MDTNNKFFLPAAVVFAGILIAGAVIWNGAHPSQGGSAAAGQRAQASVGLAAVAFGFFTSMNQALVGAMAGSGVARGRHTVHAPTLLAILRGWLVGPAAAVALGYVPGLLS